MAGRHTLTIVLAFLTMTCAAGTPTHPSTTSLAGRWHGTFTVTSCAVSGSYDECPTLPPGVVQPAVLVLTQQGSTISGTAVYGDIRDAVPGWYHPFTTVLEPDGRLRILTGWGQSPGTVTKLQWDLRVEERDRLTGSLTVTHTWYKIPGAAVSAGHVTVAREPAR